MTEERVGLIADVDWRPGVTSTKRAEGEITGIVGRMDAATKKVETSAMGVGVAMQRTAQLGQRAMTAMSAGIGAATAATAAGERQWISLGAVILGAFAAGGPVAGAIALIGAGVGVMTSQLGKAGDEAVKRAEASRQRVAALEKSLRDSSLADVAASLNVSQSSLSQLADIDAEIERATADLQKQLDLFERLQAANGYGFVDGMAANEKNVIRVSDAVRALVNHIDTARAVAAQLRKELNAENVYGTLARVEEMQSLRDRNALMAEGLSGGQNRSNETSILQGIATLERAIVAARMVGDRDEVGRLQEKVELEQERLGIQRQLNDMQLARVDRGLSREIELLEARNDKDREAIRLRHRVQDLTEQGASSLLVDRLARASAEAAAAAPWNDLLRSAESTLGQGLSDVIYDGIVNGFENASDIAEQVWQTLLKSLINHFVQSGIEGLLSGIGGGGGGGMLGIFSGLLGGGGGGGTATYGSGGGVLEVVTGGGGGGLIESIGGDPFSSGGYEVSGMAEGGIATRPTLRMVGERGPEAVVPLHRMAQVAGQGGGGASIGNINVNVTGGGDVEQTARLAAARVYQAVRESGSMRGVIKHAARSGL